MSSGLGKAINAFLQELKELFCGFDFLAGSANSLLAYNYCYLMVRSIILIKSCSSHVIKHMLLLLIF